jgi:hypothetical protein
MPSLPRTLACCAAAVVAAAVPATALAKKPVAGYHYVVVKASSKSSASETGGSFYGYNGATSASWSLRKKTKDVPNSGDFSYIGQGGQITFNVRGAYKDEVHTQFGQPGGDPSENNCVLSAPTGSKTYPAVAPESAQISILQKSRKARAKVGFNFPMANLQNPYFPTGCSNPDTEFPADKFFVTSVPAKTLTRKQFTLVNARTPGGKYGNYTWKTSVTLKRVKVYR